MPIEGSGLASELLLALDRRSGDPLHSHDLRRRVTLRDEPGAANGGLVGSLPVPFAELIAATRQSLHIQVANRARTPGAGHALRSRCEEIGGITSPR